MRDLIRRVRNSIAMRIARASAVAGGSVEGIHNELAALRVHLQSLERLLTGTAAARVRDAAVVEPGSPTVAIIMAAYNRPHCIPDAIASVRRQSYPHWELMIVDDGSGPETFAAIAPFLTDSRIRYVRQDNAGSNNARNRGIAETTAPLIAYLDDDNLWYPDFLAAAVRCFTSSPEVDVLYGALVTDDHGLDGTRILWRPFDRGALLRGNYIDTSTIVHRRGLVERYGAWDQSVARLGDWYIMLKYTADKPAYALDILAARYRVFEGQRMTDEPEALARAEILRRVNAAFPHPAGGWTVFVDQGAT